MVDSLIQRLLDGQKELYKEFERLKATTEEPSIELTGEKSQQTSIEQQQNNVTSVATVSGCHDYTALPSNTTRRSCGALDKRLNESRRTWKTPRRSAGEGRVCPGYDWVAGLLDTSPGVSQYSSEWLQELKEFRQINHSECYMPHHQMLTSSEDNKSHPLDNSHVMEYDFDQSKSDVRSYYMSERLFPIPINCSCKNDMLCPVCEDLLQPPDHKESSSIVQVSVPRSILQVPYQLRPHRRISFNPSDSMGLSQHCLSGWHTSQTSAVPNHQSISLKSSLH